MSTDVHDREEPERPPDPLLDAQIIAVAGELFRTRGWRDVTMTEIAGHAGVSEAVLHQRYPSKASLAFDAWAADRATRFPNTDTGSVWGDLTAYILGSLEMAKTAGWLKVLSDVVAERPGDPMVSEALKRVWEWRRGVVDGILRRAEERGEIAAETSAARANELLDGALLMRLLVTGDPTDVEFADRLVDDVMLVIGPGR